MRILLVGDYPNDPRLGSAKVYAKLSAELVALGHECDTILGDTIGAPSIVGRVRWALGPVLAERAIARQMDARGGYDVIDAASAEALGVAMRRRAGSRRYGRVAIVNRSHGLEHLNYARMLDDHLARLVSKPLHRRLWYPLVRLSQVAAAARLSDRLLVLNDAERAFAFEQGWKSRSLIDVIPHGVSAELVPDEYPAGPRGEGILFCGSWDAVKGIAYLVEAFSLVAASDVAARLTLLGPGRPEAEVLSAFSPAVRSRVRVIPRADEVTVFEHYRRHDLLVMSSTYEGFGMVTLEAMSQGLPVVATAVGGAPSLVRDGVNGVLVATRSVVALSDAMLRLLADPALRERMGRAAFESVRSRTWATTAARTAETYERAIAGR